VGFRCQVSGVSRLSENKELYGMEDFEIFKKEGPRMLNGLEKTLEWKVPERKRSSQITNQNFKFPGSGKFRIQTLHFPFLTPDT
jgi:hypothetical protein